MISRETIQRIMDEVHIEEVVGDFVSLRKRGANYVGCCPFHDEKTPSFVVTPAKGIYKCFGCGKAGDAVRFMMEHERYTYPEALRYLADRYHIKIEEEVLTEEQRRLNTERDTLFHVSEFAQKYFSAQLFDNEIGRAVGLGYFHERGMSDDIIKRFGLGYCQDEWTDFTDHARKQGYTDESLEKTGLTIFKEGKRYDRFRGRVMFPIYSISGRVLGFSGRILTKEKQAAKYVNSPDSEIYNKGRILYGLYQARNAIAKQDKCYLVEGNIDVISMFQSGVENTVASCGTALTTEQIKLIKRFTQNVTVVYDGDSAGIHATVRAVNLLFEEGMHVRMVLFPDNDDPDSYAQKHGSTALQDYLNEHEDNFIGYRVKVMAETVKHDPIRKAEALKEIVQTIALVPDLLERSQYIQICSSALNVAEATLQNELTRAINNRQAKLYESTRKATTNIEPPNNQPQTDPTPLNNAPSEDAIVKNVERILNQDEPQERKIISLLLNYAKEYIGDIEVEVNGTSTFKPVSLAEFVISDLDENNIKMSNEVYKSVMNIFRTHLKENDPIDGQYFAALNDEPLRNLALSLMVDTYSISPRWKEKHVHVPTPKSLLKQDVEASLNYLKKKKVQHAIDENAKELELAVHENNENKIMELLQQKNMLDKTMIVLSAQLNNVINPPSER